ncbi:MAG: hypothetical protein DRN20_05660, partial [Thermoplasmata archaeon]
VEEVKGHEEYAAEEVEAVSARGEGKERAVGTGGGRRWRRISEDFIERWKKIEGEKEDEEKRILRAIKEYDDLLSIDPTLAKAWQIKGSLYARLGRWREALECYDRAIELRPESEEEIKTELLSLLEMKFDKEKADIDWKRWTEGEREKLKKLLKYYDYILEALPEYSKAWQLKGEVLEKLGEYDEAIKCYDKAIEINDRNREAYRRKLAILDMLAEARAEEKVAEKALPRKIWAEEKGEVLAEGEEWGYVREVEAKERAEGIERAKVEEYVSKVAAETYGVPEGLINGIASIGAINGRGIVGVNGLINGVGFINGRGLINGDALINGRGRIYVRRRRRYLRNYIMVILATILLFVLPVIFAYVMLVVTPPKAISVDGNFEDWKDIPAFADVVGDVLPALSVPQHLAMNITRGNTQWIAEHASLPTSSLASLDIVETKTVANHRYVYFYIRTNGSIPPTNSINAYYVLIDTDMNESTGYKIQGIGAEAAIGVVFSPYTKSSFCCMLNTTAPWYLWDTLSKHKPKFAFNDSCIEIECIKSWIDMPANTDYRAVILAKNSEGFIDCTDSVISPQWCALVVRQFTPSSVLESGVISPGVQTPVLGIEFSAVNRNASISSIKIHILGNNSVINEISLYIDNGDGVFSIDDNILCSKENPSNFVTMKFDPPINVGCDEKSLAFVCVNINDISAGVFGVQIDGVSDITANIPVTLVSSIYGRFYANRVPEGIEIDGAFGDWNSVPKNIDKFGDAVNLNIDIDKYAIDVLNGTMYFYLSVNGRIFGGDSLPVPLTMPQPKDSDGDGILDEDEPGFEHDFDNDGIPDDMDNDKDNDGVLDYDWGGNDTWLENIATGAIKYIGPPLPPPEPLPFAGEDMLMLMIDADGRNDTGYSFGYIGVDYLLIVGGKEGIIVESKMYIYNGTGKNWKWTYAKNISAASGLREVELCMGDIMNAANTTTDIKIYYYMVDWKKEDDTSDTHVTVRVTKKSSGTRTNTVEKTLYLRNNYVMNTTMGNNAQSVTIVDGNSVTWAQTPPFAKKFTINGTVYAHLYLDNIDAWPSTPTVEVYLYANGNLIGSSAVDASTAGWYSFNLGTVNMVVNAGQSLSLVVGVKSVIGRVSVDVYYNSAQYNSRVVLPTDTYVHVDSVITYNATSNSA